MRYSAIKSNLIILLLRVIMYGSSFLVLGNSAIVNSSLDSKKDSLLSQNTTQIPNYISIVSINNSYMYISDGSGTISIVSSDNETINGEMGIIEVASNVKDLIARNKKLYILTNISLEIFDVSNPIKSVLLKRYDIEDPVGFDISSTDIYIVTSDKLIQIDANSPFIIYENSKTAKLVGPLDIVVIESNAYLSIQKGVQVIDISDPNFQNSLGLYLSMREALDIHHESLHYEYDDHASIAPLLNPENLRQFSTFEIFGSDDVVLMKNKFNYYYSEENLEQINSTDSIKVNTSSVLENNYGPIKDEQNNELVGRVIQQSNGNEGFVVFSEFDEADNINKKSESEVKSKRSNKNLPQNYKLNNNYPNPFNPSTTIQYEIPKNIKSEFQEVRLIVYDIFGRRIKVLVAEMQTAGYYSVEWQPENVSSGIYFYRISIKNSSNIKLFYNTKKMIFLK